MYIVAITQPAFAMCIMRLRLAVDDYVGWRPIKRIVHDIRRRGNVSEEYSRTKNASYYTRYSSAVTFYRYIYRYAVHETGRYRLIKLLYCLACFEARPIRLQKILDICGFGNTIKKRNLRAIIATCEIEIFKDSVENEVVKSESWS